MLPRLPPKRSYSLPIFFLICFRRTASRKGCRSSFCFARCICFELTKQMHSDFEDNPTGTPAKRADRGGFPSPRDILRAHILHNRAASPFLQERFRANRGALSQKRGSACASVYKIECALPKVSFWHAQSFIKGAALKRAEIINARGFLAELTAAKSCELRTTPLPSLWSGQRRFSSPRDILRAHILHNRAASPFLQERFRANRGALSQKRGSACASVYKIECALPKVSFWHAQ